MKAPSAKPQAPGKLQAPTPRPVNRLIIGKFCITPTDGGKVWIEIEGGEGMEIAAAKLEAELDAFWEREF